MARDIRDYANHRYANPLFERKRGLPRRFPWKRWLGALVIVVAVALGAWFLLFSSYLRVTDIEVTGNSRVQAWEVQDAVKGIMKERRWYLVPESNILILPEAELVARLTDQFVFASVEVTRRPPHRLDIAVRERASTVTLKFPDGSRAVLGLDGAVLRLYRPDDPEPDPKFLEHEALCDQISRLTLKQQAFAATTVTNIIEASENFKTIITDGVEVKEIHLDAMNGRTLRLVTTEGWMIYVDARAPLPAQLQAAALVLKEKVGADRPKLDYIDVRFGEKIYFKLKTGS